MSGLFITDFNYKGKALEWGVKNGVDFSVNWIRSSPKGPCTFKAVLLVYVDEGRGIDNSTVTGEFFVTKKEAEQYVYWKFLDTRKLLHPENQPSILKMPDTEKENKKLSHVLTLHDFIHMVNQTSNEYESASDSDDSFDIAKNVAASVEKDFNIFDPFKQQQREVSKEYMEFLTFRGNQKLYDALYKYRESHPMMVNNVVSKYVVDLVNEILLEGEKTSLEMAKLMLGAGATTSQINPILYRINNISKTSSGLWTIIFNNSD